MKSSHQAAVAAGTVSRSMQRRWVRRDAPIWPFVWRGLLPLLGLVWVAAYALLPFARDDIQATVLRETRAHLDARGLKWAELSVSGQHVIVGGSPPSAEVGDAAINNARSATCPSWLGRFRCAVDVQGRFPQPAPGMVPKAQPAPASGLPAVASARACEKALADVLAQTKIEFAVASATIESRSAPVLDALARGAAQCPGIIVVEGHTDSIGAPQANRALSVARADAVRAALIERGLAPARLRAEGFGDERPLAANDNAMGRARNRRIEFRAATGAL